MKKLALVTLLATLCAASLPLMADTAYSNLGNPPSYACCNGWTVGGSNSIVGLVEDAQQFTSATTGTVTQIDVGLGWVLGTNSAQVQLWTDVGGAPGVMLGGGSVSNMPVFGQSTTQLSTVSGNLGSVVTGQTYFVVILAADDAWEAWNLNDIGAVGLLDQNNGNGWNQFPGNIEGAFDVITGGTTTPEPGTLVMLGSGVLAMAGVIRRKFSV